MSCRSWIPTKSSTPSLNASINPIVSLSPVPMLDPIKRAAMTPMKLLLELMRFAVTAFQMGSPDLIKMAKSLSSWGSSCTRTDADTTQPSEPQTLKAVPIATPSKRLWIASPMTIFSTVPQSMAPLAGCDFAASFIDSSSTIALPNGTTCDRASVLALKA